MKSAEGQEVPWTTASLRSPGSSEVRGLVSKIVDRCQHPVTMVGEDGERLLTLKARAPSGQPPQQVASGLPIPQPSCTFCGRRMTAAVQLIQALGGGWHVADLPSTEAVTARQ